MDPVVEASSAASKGPRKNPMVVIWEFTRPHTIIGSILSIVSLHLFAASAPGLSVLNLSALGTALLWALVSGALVNLYVTGLNQLFDVEIDKVNKPYLPIAAGELSERRGWVLVLSALLLGTIPIALWYPYDPAPLLATTLGSALLGTAYSAPPVRLKRFPLLAAFCIIVRAPPRRAPLRPRKRGARARAARAE
jgi:homogentisate phytyltransferase/homogentisate geranylgeranyltransferase